MLLANVCITVANATRSPCIALLFSPYFISIDNTSHLLHHADCPKGNKERLTGERSEGRLAEERGEPLDIGIKQEMDLQTKDELQVHQRMKKKEERPEEYPLMYIAATRGVLWLLPYKYTCTSTIIILTASAAGGGETLEREENREEAYQTEEEGRGEYFQIYGSDICDLVDWGGDK